MQRFTTVRYRMPLFTQQRRQLLLLLALLMGIAYLPARAHANAQTISLSVEKASLSKVLMEIRRQTGINFVYTTEVLQSARPVTAHIQGVQLKEALDICLKDQPLTYSIVDRMVVIKINRTTTVTNTSNTTASGKKIQVRGVVTSESGPVEAATVAVKGTEDITTTNKEGVFTLPGVEEEGTLVISSVGYETQQVRLKGQTYISVTLNITAKDLDEAVVVAYNKTTARANTGAVTVVKGEQIQNLPNRSFDKSLQGLVPGLLVTSGSGQPGSPPSNFTLRGIATGGQPTNGETFRNPLIVIDGVPVSQEPATLSSNNTAFPLARVTNPLAQLNPSDIESISVLKDAAAIALYGSKASNGVILVTTKKGKAGKTVFNFRHQTDIASALQGKITMLNQQQYLELLYEAYKNTNSTVWTDAAILADLKTKFPSKSDGSFYAPADWQSALFNSSAVTYANEVSMSGGNDRSNFYLNLEYTKQNGVAQKSGFDRKSLRFNYEHRPTTWLKLGMNTTLSYNVQDYSDADGLNFLLSSSISPLNPIRQENGNYVYTYQWGHLASNIGQIRANPVAGAELNIRRNTAYRGLSKLYGEVKLLKDITFSSAAGVDFMLNEAKEKINPLVSIFATNGSIQEENYRTLNLINTNILRYDKKLHDHQINLLAGQEARISNTKASDIRRTNLSDNPDQDQLIGGTIAYAQGYMIKQTQLSYFGQANYGFCNKYFLSGSIRTDGASNFGPNNRFGTYWSVGAGWIVSDESFLKSSKGWLNYLKLRGSMGPAGNSAAIADQLRFDRLLLTNYLNTIAVLPFNQVNPGNPSIQWEQTFTWDAGAELRLLKERIAITVDIYTRKTKNLIAYNINIPFATGFNYSTDNIGDVKNQGIELSLSASIIQTKNFRWNINANWSRNRNRLTKSFFPRSAIAASNLVNEVGYEYNSFYLRRWAGVNPENGRPTWVDSTTGKPTENYYAAKQEIVGKTQPDGFGAITQSFSYKAFEVSAMFYYQYGGQVYLTSELQNDGNNPYLNQAANALNRWKKPGDIAANPRRLLNGSAITATGTITDLGGQASTRYLYEGDFIRLSNLVIAYNFPKRLLEPLHISATRIFVQGQNLATWTRYAGQDPENVGPSGLGGILYPQQRTYSIGVNVVF